MSNLLLPPALGARVVSREPYTDVRIDTSASGKEARSSWWTLPRTRYKVAFEVLRQDLGSRADFQQIASLFARHFGQLDSFLFTDEADSSVSDHGFGVGDGSTTAYQLQRTLQGSVYDTTGGPWAASSKPRTNLCTNSQTFGSWTQNACSVLADADTAPDGTRTADRVLESATTATHGVVGNFFAVMVGTAYTIGVWVKAAGRTSVSLDGSGFQGLTVFNLSTGTVTSGPGTIRAGSNGWYFCSTTFVATQATASVNVYLQGGSSYAGDGASGVYLWGAQAEAASAATQYIATTSAAVTVNPAYWPSYSDGFEPVWDPAPGATLYKDGDGLGRRVLVPWSRTNLALQSQTVATAPWGANNVTVANAATTAPDGTSTACNLTEDSTNNQHYANQLVTLTAGQFYTWSAWVKPQGRTWFLLQMFHASDAAAAYFNLSGAGSTSTISASGTGSNASAAITACPNGWYRCSLTFLCGTTVGHVMTLTPSTGAGAYSYLGTGILSASVWGAQLEVAASLGDYIPTTAASASRSDYTQSATGGITMAVAPASGTALSWSGSHYKRVRLDSPGLQFERLASGLYAATVDLITVKA